MPQPIASVTSSESGRTTITRKPNNRSRRGITLRRSCFVTARITTAKGLFLPGSSLPRKASGSRQTFTLTPETSFSSALMSLFSGTLLVGIKSTISSTTCSLSRTVPHYAELAESAAKADILGFQAINHGAAIRARRLKTRTLSYLQDSGRCGYTRHYRSSSRCSLQRLHTASIVIDNPFTALVDSHVDEAARSAVYSPIVPQMKKHS